jgi:hypothetical protein
MSCELKERFTGGEVKSSLLSSCKLNTQHWLQMVKRVGIRSRARRNCTRSYRGGQPPRTLPTRGTYPPRSPGSNPTIKAFILFHTLTPHASRLQVAERVGFEPTVPLLGRMLSKHVDSTTLAPLHTDFARRYLNTRSGDRQGERQWKKTAIGLFGLSRVFGFFDWTKLTR